MPQGGLRGERYWVVGIHPLMHTGVEVLSKTTQKTNSDGIFFCHYFLVQQNTQIDVIIGRLGCTVVLCIDIEMLYLSPHPCSKGVVVCAVVRV